MPELRTCAKCGKKAELCNSATEDGVRSPRICKDCLIVAMRTEDWGTSTAFWLKQLAEDDDRKSFDKLCDSMELAPTEKESLKRLYKLWQGPNKEQPNEERVAGKAD